MRIVGGRDYYDGGAAYGRDATVTFVRHKDKFLGPAAARAAGLPPPLLLPRWDVLRDGRSLCPRCSLDAAVVRVDGVEYRFGGARVWFCGKRWSAVQVTSWSAGDIRPPRTPEPPEAFLWTEADLVAWGARRGLEVARRGAAPGWWKEEGRDDQDAFFGPSEPTRTIMDFLVANRISIMTWRPLPGLRADQTPWRIDGDDLKSLGFYRAVDVHAAFQELSMWVGGVLPRPGANTVEILDDVVKAGKHGFDRWSFRRPPGGR
jgi:hypothetical protein